MLAYELSETLKLYSLKVHIRDHNYDHIYTGQ